MDFDIIGQARFNHVTTRLLHHLRDELDSQSNKVDFASKWGLSLNRPMPLDKLAIDRHLQTPHDPAHALLQNITRCLIATTLKLLNSAGEQAFSSALRSYHLPHGWPSFQDPVNHLSSFFFADCGHLMAIGPFLLNNIKEEHFKRQTLEALKSKLSLHRISQVIVEIFECWVVMARANALCFAEEIEDYTKIDESLVDLVKQLMRVSYCILSALFAY